MTTAEKKTLKALSLIIFIVIFLLLFGFVIGIIHADKNNEQQLNIEIIKQKTIDSLETKHYKQLVDSLTVENKVWMKAYNSISQFKKETKKNIDETTKKINSVSDSNIQRYVDSLRSSGFN